MAPLIWTTQSGFLTNQKLSLDFQKVAQPLLKFRQFVSIKEAFGKNGGESVNWLKVSNVGTYGGKLVETNTFHESDQTLTWGTLSVTEYGNSIPFTFKLESLSEFDIKEIIRDGLLDDAVKCIDGEVERQFNATLLRYVGTATAGFALTTNGTATATNTSITNPYHIRKMALELKKRNVPGWLKSGGDYAFVGSCEAVESLMGGVEGINQYTDAGYGKILNGEQGKLYGVRIVEDTFASRNTYDSTAKTATAITWTQSQSLVGYMCGSPTVKEAVTVPEEIRAKLVSDYGRSKGLAWYFLGGWKIDWDTSGGADSRIIKWDSAA